MKNLGLPKVMFWSLVALVIPFLGNHFVDGWNWEWHDFLFAWVFFVIMATSIKVAMRQVPNKSYRVVIGTLVFLIFAAIWVMLATG